MKFSIGQTVWHKATSSKGEVVGVQINELGEHGYRVKIPAAISGFAINTWLKEDQLSAERLWVGKQVWTTNGLGEIAKMNPDGDKKDRVVLIGSYHYLSEEVFETEAEVRAKHPFIAGDYIVSAGLCYRVNGVGPCSITVVDHKGYCFVVYQPNARPATPEEISAYKKAKSAVICDAIDKAALKELERQNKLERRKKAAKRLRKACLSAADAIADLAVAVEAISKTTATPEPKEYGSGLLVMAKVFTTDLIVPTYKHSQISEAIRYALWMAEKNGMEFSDHRLKATKFSCDMIYHVGNFLSVQDEIESITDHNHPESPRINSIIESVKKFRSGK